MTLLHKSTLSTMALVICLSATFSCKKKSSSEETIAPIPAGSSRYAVSVRVQGTGETTADYVLTTDNIMSGEISVVGKGIEQPGWCYYMGNGNNLFSINYGEEGTRAYSLGGTEKLVEKGKFWVDRLDCMGKVDENYSIGIGAPWGGGSYDCELMVVDVNKVAISSRRTHYLYKSSPDDKLNKWPTGAIARDGKIYVPFYPLDGPTWETPIMDTAYVSVYKYPTLEYITTIKDPRGAPIGMYGSVPSIVMTENKDIYTISPNAYVAGYTKTGNPSSILRIKNGEDKFDTSYFFNFEEQMNAKLVMINYIGNNKALIRYTLSSNDNSDRVWGLYSISLPFCKLAIVDLVTKEVKPITDIPDHGSGYAGGAFMENGKAYISITSSIAGEVRVYEIDPATATAKKGAVVKGLEAPLIYKLHN